MFGIEDFAKKKKERQRRKMQEEKSKPRREGDFFHQKIIKVFYGDDGFDEPAVRSVNVKGWQ